MPDIGPERWNMHHSDFSGMMLCLAKGHVLELPPHLHMLQSQTSIYLAVFEQHISALL